MMFWSPTRQIVSLFLCFGLLTSVYSRRLQVADDIRIDLSPGGLVKIENRFGDVSAEIWSNRFVSVSANVPADAHLSRSPILLDNRGSVLNISVVRAPQDSAVSVHLIVKIPDSARLEISTNTGEIVLDGLPAQAVLKSVSGNIQSKLPAGVDAKIKAQTARGVITSDISNTPVTDDHLFQAKLGAASKALEIQSQSGQISLISTASVVAGKTADLKEPGLIGPDNAGRPAGVPDKPSGTDEISEGDIIRVDSQLVTINMSVTDRNTNRGFSDLHQSDFNLFEDGQQQQIVQFDSAAAPFDMILLIDLSGSTKDVVKLIRAAAQRFIDATRPADRIAIITFAGEAAVISELTADRGVLRQRVEMIDTARGDTKLYDAVDFTVKHALTDNKKSRRTAIVLMSDGLDGTIPGVSGQQGSRNSYPETLRSIQEFDGVLYSLWLNTEYQAFSPLDTQPEAFDMGHDRMKEMADAGGGVFYEVDKLADLAGAYEQVVADLGTVYSLAYRPTNSLRDGKWRSIRIAVARSNAVARGKRGYYAN
ncbi:MAG TPA: VWA domain-containing protein [Pyrinomonadaceae bacterium]|nr:VWA domain-containing protein [Pyrinomonadaceae bacterium]